MYVKVHMKNNHWYRIDTNEHYGKNIPIDSQDYIILKSVFGDHYFSILNECGKNSITTIYYGYFDKNGIFFNFCQSKKCFTCPKRIRTLFCPKLLDEYKSKTGGYYIKLPN